MTEFKDYKFYAVNDRPVKIIRSDTHADVVVFDFTTGGFVSDQSYWEHVDTPSPYKDVDTLTKEQFDELVHSRRMRVVAKHVNAPLVWEATGDARIPFKTIINGHTFTVRINDATADLAYTLLADGEEIADLEAWPNVWKRP